MKYNVQKNLPRIKMMIHISITKSPKTIPSRKNQLVTNATERNDNNERSTETVRDDKEHFTGNYDKDNSSQSSQGIIEVDNGVLPTDDNEVGRQNNKSSKYINQFQ